MLYTKDRNLLNIFSRANGVAVLALAVVGSIFVPTPTSAGRHARTPSTGLRNIAFAKPAPDFEFDSGDGPMHLAALAGRPVVLSFWATWCEPCRAELPALGRLRSTYGDAVSLLTISDEPAGRARAFLAQQHLVLPVVEDPERKIFQAYSITPIPVTLVLLADGTVSYVSVGETSWDELASAISAALISRAPSAAQAQ